MYGKGVGTVNTATGVALLPSTGDSRLLFAIATGLLVSGVIILIAATVMARKNSHNEAN